jgi:predicted RNase H-like nuclease (RuvC/YqgF family)
MSKGHKRVRPPRHHSEHDTAPAGSLGYLSPPPKRRFTECEVNELIKQSKEPSLYEKIKSVDSSIQSASSEISHLKARIEAEEDILRAYTKTRTELVEALRAELRSSL